MAVRCRGQHHSECNLVLPQCTAWHWPLLRDRCAAPPPAVPSCAPAPEAVHVAAVRIHHLVGFAHRIPPCMQYKAVHEAVQVSTYRWEGSKRVFGAARKHCRRVWRGALGVMHHQGSRSGHAG